MRITKRDIIIYRMISTGIILISILVILFLSKAVGYPMLALGLFFLFAPFKPGSDI